MTNKWTSSETHDQTTQIVVFQSIHSENPYIDVLKIYVTVTGDRCINQRYSPQIHDTPMKTPVTQIK